MDSVLSFGYFARLLDSNNSKNKDQYHLIYDLVSSIDPNHPICKSYDYAQEKPGDRSTINNIIKGRKNFSPITKSNLPNVEDLAKTINIIFTDRFMDDAKVRIISSLFWLIREDILITFDTRESFRKFFKMQRYDFLNQQKLNFDRLCASVLLYTTCTKIDNNKASSFLKSFSDEDIMKFQNEAVKQYAKKWNGDNSCLEIKTPEPIMWDPETLERFLYSTSTPEISKILDENSQKEIFFDINDHGKKLETFKGFFDNAVYKWEKQMKKRNKN